MTMTTDDLHKLITQGENARVEFKEDLTDPVLDGLSTDIAAFANSQGGVIIFGVTDKREAKGCTIRSNVRERISQAATNCRPAISIDIEDVAFGDRHFLVVKVPPSTIVHSDLARRFPVRIGSITDYLDALALIPLLQERGLTSREATQEMPAPTERKRESMKKEDTALITAALKSNEVTIRIEVLKDLASMMHQQVVLDRKDVADGVAASLNSENKEELALALDLVRVIFGWGGKQEQEFAKPLLPSIIQIAKSSNDPLVARRAFEAVLTARDAAAGDILVHWIRNLDETLYNSISPQGAIQNAGYYGLKDSIRESMYSLLREGADETQRKRVSVILDYLRHSQ